MKTKTYVLEGLSIGLMLGTSLGAAFHFELAIGAGLGSLIGSAIGAALKKRGEDDYESNQKRCPEKSADKEFGKDC